MWDKKIIKKFYNWLDLTTSLNTLSSMHLYYPLWTSISPHTSSSLIIGAFDGIHWWHYSLWQTAYRYPQDIVVLTFDPPPKTYFTHQNQFQSLEDRYEIMMAWKTRMVYVLDFDLSIVQLSALDFINQILSQIMIARIIVWQDFRFGYQQEWDIHLLKEYYTCDIVTWSENKISSSMIRDNPDHYNYQLVKLDHYPHRWSDAIHHQTF